MIKESKSIFTDLSDEGSHLLKTGFKRYLNKQKDKYSHLKTLLRGNSPVYLYEIYYPLKLTSGGQTLNTNTVSEVFSATNCVTILGDAGSGKSTLIKHLFLNSIYTKYAIPVLVELRYLNDYESVLEDYINKKILESKIAENPRILERLLEGGKFVFFLDGYDELNSEVKESMAENLGQFIDKYGNNDFVITTRPYSGAEHFQNFHNYEVKKLSFEDQEIEGFIYKQLTNETELAKKIVASIKNNNSEHIHSFLTNPLLLSLYILTFQSNADIPSKKHIFYRRVIQALFSEHDSKTKLGFVREKQSGLKQEEFEKILKAFCFVSYFEQTYNWDVDYIFPLFEKIKNSADVTFDSDKVVGDLKSAVALWVEDNGDYSFAHRSLQEYFVALFIKNLSSSAKDKAYAKIVSRFEDDLGSDETENLMSLLQEVDTIDFLRKFKIPLLEELRGIIDNSSEHSLCDSFVNFFAGRILLRSRDRAPKKSNPEHSKLFVNVDVNNCVYKAIHFHLPYTQMLYDDLRVTFGGIDSIQFEKYVNHEPVSTHEFIPSKRKNSRHGAKNTEIMQQCIDLKNDICPELRDLLREISLEAAKKFDAYIDGGILEAKSYIKHAHDVDDELVGLI